METSSCDAMRETIVVRSPIIELSILSVAEDRVLRQFDLTYERCLEAENYRVKI